MKLNHFFNRIQMKELWIIALVIPVFMVLFKVAVVAYSLPVDITPIWPPAGLSVAAVLVYGRRAFPALALGISLSHLFLFPVNPSFFCFSFTVNAILPFFAIWLQKHVLRQDDILEESVDGIRKFLLVGFIIAVLTGFVGVTGFYSTGMASVSNFPKSWLIWTLGDSLGILVTGPAFLRIFLLLRKHLQIRKPIQTYLDTERLFWICLILAAFSILPYTSYWNSQYLLSMGFILLGLLLWSALRFQPIFTKTAIMVIVLTIWSLIGLQTPGLPYPSSTPEVINLLFFSAIVAFFPLIIAITTQKSRILQKRLSHQAYHDGLTGLLNRRGFEEETVAFLEARKGPLSAAMVFLNLDRLKQINDSCGHLAGDHLLEQVGFFMQAHFTENAFIGRFSGDIFSILLYQTDEDSVNLKLESLRQKIQDYRFIWEGERFSVSASIGAVYLITPRSLSILLSKADMACQISKEAGGNKVTLLNVEDHTLDQKRRRWSLFGRIGKALETDSFLLYAQPIVALQRGNFPHHYEILLRMKDNEGNVLLPGEFLPIAEQNHLMRHIDYWVVDHTLQFIEAHYSRFKSDILFTINLSGQALNSRSFQDKLVERISKSSIPGSTICFEISENATIQNLRMVQRFFERVKSFNCSFALDDFGKGFSSFSYLKLLPVDYIKIDGSFIRDAFDSEMDQAMVKAIAEIGSSLGLKTIAEFVCSEELNELMTYLKIDYGQGSFLGDPQELHSLLHSLKEIS